MKYLALGDSISIDDYTGVEGGGAASQFARKIGAARPDFQNLTRDGNTTDDVLCDLLMIRIHPDVITLTVGGNDLLCLLDTEGAATQIGDAIEEIVRELERFACPVILNTVYDPSDGDDRLGAQFGISPALRKPYTELNDRIRRIARDRGLLLSDLERLFHGHGVASRDPWFVQVIEPNLKGATAIAEHWHELHPATAAAS